MKHLKLFCALFAMLALGVGNAWGAEATINFSEKGLENGVQYSDPFTIDANTTITFAGGDNDGKYYNTGTGIRTYGDGTITVECTNGTISEISFTWSGNSYKPAAEVASPAGYSTSTDKWTGSASSVTLTRPSGSGHWRLQEVTVTYETAGGGEDPGEGGGETPEPEPEPEPTTTNWVATDIANISATDVVVVTMSSGSTTWALTSANGSSSAPTAVAVTVANDGLTEEPADALKWNISNTDGSLTIYPNGTTATWLYCTNANNGVRVGTGAAKVFTIDKGYLYTTGTTDPRHIGVYNQQDWRCYKPTDGAIANNITGQTLKFYKYVEPTSGGEGEEPTLAAPTFSLAEDTYTEAQEVTLSAEEGTIYYTLDGTTPDAESTEYTEPIVLEECGTTTIKAIAISGEITSSVASATYTIKLPLNNSQANPYTEADAIEVYDGGCYDNQDVYVKGVVANAQFYSSNTYTITLEGGFQFYKFYEAAGEVTFTENYIVAGDTLVACGKLDNYKGTYQLAAGCYLVEYKPYSLPKEDISNTPETAYTVEEAIALIDDITSDLTKQVYVKGTVSEIVEYNADYGNITYNISSDGSTSSPQFQLYRGKSYDGDKFTSADGIKVGDKVVVYGEMKKHNSTYEMNAGNQLVALEREDTTTALDNVEATVTPVKAIVNGQLIIIKNGVQYNAQGQVIK